MQLKLTRGSALLFCLTTTIAERSSADDTAAPSSLLEVATSATPKAPKPPWVSWITEDTMELSWKQTSIDPGAYSYLYQARNSSDTYNGDGFENVWEGFGSNRTRQLQSTSVTMRGLEKDKYVYFFKVTCVSELGDESHMSAMKSFNMTQYGPDMPPPFQDNPDSRYQQVVKWKKPRNARISQTLEYELQINNEETSNYEWLTVFRGTPRNGTSHLQKDLRPYSGSKYRLRGKNLMGWGFWSKEVFLPTAPAPPDAERTKITLIQAKSNFLSVEWGEADPLGFPILFYELESARGQSKSSKPDEPWRVVYKGLDLKHIWAFPVSPGAVVYVRLCATNKLGKGRYSKTFSFPLCTSGGCTA